MNIKDLAREWYEGNPQLPNRGLTNKEMALLEARAYWFLDYVLLKNMKITYTDIKKFLSRCTFNPRKPGALQIISDVGNPSYYETRACEFIKEAEFNLDNIGNYDNNIIKAIQLLCLARETRYQQIKDLLNEPKDNKEEANT